MTKLLGQRWISKHGLNPSPEWQRLLARFAAYNPEQVAARLVEKLRPNERGEVWPPEVADVIFLMRPNPEDFGLPHIDNAYRCAANLRWIHPTVYEAARRCGFAEYLATRCESLSRSEFEREYCEVCEEFMAGRWVPPEPVAPKNRIEKKATDRALMQARFAELRKMLGTRSVVGAAHRNFNDDVKQRQLAIKGTQ